MDDPIDLSHDVDLKELTNLNTESQNSDANFGLQPYQEYTTERGLEILDRVPQNHPSLDQLLKEQQQRESPHKAAAYGNVRPSSDGVVSDTAQYEVVANEEQWQTKHVSSSCEWRILHKR